LCSCGWYTFCSILKSSSSSISIFLMCGLFMSNEDYSESSVTLFLGSLSSDGSLCVISSAEIELSPPTAYLFLCPDIPRPRFCIFPSIVFFLACLFISFSSCNGSILSCTATAVP
jgi:hypothetical protein